MHKTIPTEVERIAAVTVDAASVVPREPGLELPESGHEPSMVYILQKRGISHRNHNALLVVIVRNVLDAVRRLDLLINECVIGKLKAVVVLGPTHTARLLTCPKLPGLRLAWFMNFNVT